MRKVKFFLMYAVAVLGLVGLGAASFFFFRMAPTYVSRQGYTPTFWLPLNKSDNADDIRERSTSFDISVYKGRYKKNPLKVLLPLSGMLEPSPFGMLPVPTNGQTPKKIYSKQAPAVTPFPKIGIMIIDLGLDMDVLELVMETMPEEVGLSFSPYTENMEAAILEARKKGFETYLDLPLQPKSTHVTDLGPMMLLTSVPEADNQEKLMQILSKNAAYSGVVGLFGEAFVSDPKSKFIAEEIKRRGLYVINATGRVYTDADISAGELLIADLSKGSIAKKLSDLKEEAKRTGRALLVLRPKPAFLYDTLGMIREIMADDTVELVPVSYLIEKGEKK